MFIIHGNAPHFAHLTFPYQFQICWLAGFPGWWPPCTIHSNSAKRHRSNGRRYVFSCSGRWSADGGEGKVRLYHILVTVGQVSYLIRGVTCRQLALCRQVRSCWLYWAAGWANAARWRNVITLVNRLHSHNQVGAVRHHHVRYLTHRLNIVRQLYSSSLRNWDKHETRVWPELIIVIIIMRKFL